MIKIEEKFRLISLDYKELLDDFDKYVNVVGYKVKDKRYQKSVQEFLSQMEIRECFDINKIRPVDLVNYYEYLLNRGYLNQDKQLSRNYVTSHMHAINVFFDFLLNNKRINGAVILPSRPIGITRNPVILSQQEIALIYNSIKNKRDKAFFSIAYGCGLRRTELECLNVADVILNKGLLIIRSGKNDKRREIPMSNKVIQDVEKYLYYYRDKFLLPNHINPALFISNKGKRIRGAQFYQKLKSIIKKTKDEEIINKNITLHSLRHSISSHLIDNGGSIEDVKRFLGHDDIDTSHIYTRRRKMKNLILKNI
jgi:integrase/recombinase XerD